MCKEWRNSHAKFRGTAAAVFPLSAPGVNLRNVEKKKMCSTIFRTFFFISWFLKKRNICYRRCKGEQVLKLLAWYINKMADLYGISFCCTRAKRFPCRGPGGVWTKTTGALCFSQIYKKTVALHTAVLWHTYSCIFSAHVQNSDPELSRSGHQVTSSDQVRSPGYVKWPHLRKSLNARHSYTDWTTAWKFQQVIWVTL